MFRMIAHLLFGAGEEVPEDAKSAEVVEEGWLVVPHQEAVSCEHQDVSLTDVQQSLSAPHADVTANMENDSLETEPAALCSSASVSREAPGSFSQARAVAELTRFTCIKKTKTWADQHVSRNAIHRQNRVRQGVPPPSFHLQQPGHRSLSH